jgi:hypothetical protein
MQAIVDPSTVIEFPAIADAALLDVMKQCLQRDPQCRPSITGPGGLLDHPFLHPEALSAILFSKLSDAAKKDTGLSVLEANAFLEQRSPAVSTAPAASASPATVQTVRSPSGVRHSREDRPSGSGRAPLQSAPPARPSAIPQNLGDQLMQKRQALRRIDVNAVEEERKALQSKPTGLAAMLAAKFKGAMPVEEADTTGGVDSTSTWLSKA